MTRRYRGENSNVDDIAARFDKHLDEPVRYTRITAHASVVKCKPGLYQLATVLMCVPRADGRGGRPGRPKMSKEEDRARRRARYWAKHHTKQENRLMQARMIASSPDDESQLWNRPALDL